MDAIRLPNNTFKGRANTGVTTDIVLFKKGFDATSNKDGLRVKAIFKEKVKSITLTNIC